MTGKIMVISHKHVTVLSAVFVLGDVGHSPRMQNHCLSLANKGWTGKNSLLLLPKKISILFENNGFQQQFSYLSALHWTW